jgi:hypothetical protein
MAGVTISQEMSDTLDYTDWHIPLSRSRLTLRQAAADLARVGADPADIPFMVRLAENPKFNLFKGAVDLKTHDYIHLILGRGLCAKDEAFVIGFTMGSTQRLSATEEGLFTLVAQHLYPGIYRFTEDDVKVFRDGVRLAFVSEPEALNQVDYAPLLDLTLAEIRDSLRIDVPLLRAYYAIENRRYPDSAESRRLLD